MIEEQYLIVWIDADHQDHFHYEEGLENARDYYNELLTDESIEIASICAVVDSTIYSKHPNL